MDGSRILGDLYTNTGPNQQQHLFAVDQSGISYQNSDQGDDDEMIEGEGMNSEFMAGGIPAGVDAAFYQINQQFNHSSSIAQDKSPLMKPFIPPLNLAGLNNRQQAARQGQQ